LHYKVLHDEFISTLSESLTASTEKVEGTLGNITINKHTS